MTLNCRFINGDRALHVYPKIVQTIGCIWAIFHATIGIQCRGHPKPGYEVTRAKEPSYRLLAHSNPTQLLSRLGQLVHYRTLQASHPGIKHSWHSLQLPYITQGRSSLSLLKALNILLIFMEVIFLS